MKAFQLSLAVAIGIALGTFLADIARALNRKYIIAGSRDIKDGYTI